MNKFKSFKANLFAVNKDNFEAHALELFNFQAKNNPVYKQYIEFLNVRTASVDRLSKIPFLPIDFFKQHVIKTMEWEPQAVFESSGTTGQIPSKHYVEDISFYHKVTERIFDRFYGKPEAFTIMALLPSYLERENSSLVAMVDHFIKKTNSPYSGFYLYDLEALADQIAKIKDKGGAIILIGVSFALLNLAEQFEMDLTDVVVMETGGMKGKREELTREELHLILKKQFKVREVHAEYGMTELMSQAYAKEKGLFEPPPWMKILIREMNDPFEIQVEGASKRAGGINVIDLANVQSCAFVETQDIGRIMEGDYFEVLGRFDNADLRGCNLLTYG